MELGSKVASLEEEIVILKGEIKTILQEVRTAVLARENPFASDAYDNLNIPARPAAPAPELLTPEPETAEPAAPAPNAPPSAVKIDAAPELEQLEPYTPIPLHGRDETDAVRPARGKPAAGRRWSVGSLATLIAWTQETAARMDPSDLDIVLSLARYGGLIDEELEATLTKLSAPLFEKDTQPKQRGVSDYLLALRELSALIEEAEDNYRDSRPLRRAS